MKGKLLLLFACMFWLFQYSHAQLLTHDDFQIDLGTEESIPASDPVTSIGVATGIGWADGWDVQGDQAGYKITDQMPLVYPGLASTPNYLVGGGGYQNAGRALDRSAGGPYDAYLNGANAIGADGTTLYWSFLAKNISGSYRLGLSAGTPWAWSPQLFSVENDGGNFRLTMNQVNYSTGIPFNTGETYFVVVKLDFDAVGGNTATLWVNPTEFGGTEPATADFTATETVATSIAFESLHYYPGSGNNQGVVDEIRFGATYADVTPKSPPLIGFDFLGVSPLSTGVIDHDLNTVTAEVPYGSDLTSLVPTITLAPNVTVSPESGVANDFTSPVNYVVTDPDAGNIGYTVTVTEAAANTDNTIQNLSINYGSITIDNAVIDDVAGTITLEVPEGMQKIYTLNYTINTFASADIPNNSEVNFDNVTGITVTAQDGTEKTYTFVLNERVMPVAFADDFSTNANLANWECRNWNNSGGGDQYTFQWMEDVVNPSDSYLQIMKSTSTNQWIRFTLPETTNLGTPGTHVRMKVSSAETINNFGLKLQDEAAPLDGDGNFSVATGTRSTIIEGGTGYQELIWNFEDVLNDVNPYLAKYLVLQADRTDAVAFTDIRIDNVRVGLDAYANNAPTHDPVSSPPTRDVNAGPQSLTITGITDGNPERDETITVTATSSNQAVVDDADINVTYDALAGTAVIDYSPSSNGNAEITVELQDDRGAVYSDEQDTKTTSFLASFISTEVGVNNPASFGVPSPQHINVGAGNRHFVVIPNVNDNYIHDVQQIFFDFVNNSPEMIGNIEITYTTGDNYAMLYFDDLGVTGNASVTVSAIDEVAQAAGDDPFELTFNIPLSIYDTYGVNYGATDIQQWQPKPYKTDPTFKAGYPIILDDAYAPDDPALNFFWGRMTGYIIPPETGTYRFYVNSDGEGDAHLYVSTDATQGNIPAESAPTAKINEPSGMITLEGGKALYFEAYHKEIVNDFFLEVSWIRPGDAQPVRMSAPNVFYFLDQELPAAPMNLTSNGIGSEQVNISWDEAIDNNLIQGYRVFVNGNPVNAELTKETSMTITGLEPGTDYDIFVQAADEANNYSGLSNVLSVTTYGEDNLAPSVPDGLSEVMATAFSLTVSWNASTDNETVVYGYNVYIDGSTTPFNDEPIFGTEYKLSGLSLSTDYAIAVTAIDAGLNESDKSTELLASTTAFQWDNPAEETYVGLASFDWETVAPATGVAVEGSSSLGSIFLSNKVPHSSFEDDRFTDGISNENLNALGLGKSGGTYYTVEETNPYHGNRAARLEVAGGDWIYTEAGITMNPIYNYRLSFAARGESSYDGGTITVRVFRDVGGTVVAHSETITPTQNWEEYVMEFPGIQDAFTSWKVEFRFDKFGVVLLDDVQLHIQEWYDPNSKFTTVGQDILEELKPTGVRWGAIDANSKKFFESSGAYQQKGLTMADFAHLASVYNGYALLTVGVNSATDWMQNPATFSNFVEYLNGPAGTTWGDVRIAEGYAQPFTETLKGIIIEMGNEVWGYDAHDADEFDNNYANYSTWAANMTENYIKSSDYFDPEKMWVSFSGRSPSNNYGLHNALFSNENDQMDMLSISGYLGGNLNYDPSIPVGESQLDYHKNTYKRFEENLSGLDDIFREMLMRMERVVPQYMYEGNLTRSEYNGTAGQAVTMMDYYAATQKNGVGVTNAFALEGGQWRLIDNQITLAKRPFYHHIKYFNQIAKSGEILRTSFNSIREIYDETGAVVDLDPVGTYAYHNEGAYGVALFSRDFENDYVVSVDLPDDIGTITNGSMVVITSDSFNSSNVNVEETVVTVEDEMLVNVPRHGAVYISFAADAKVLEEKPLGNYEYQKATQINVTTQDNRTTLDGFTDQIGVTVEVLPSDVFYGAWNYEILDNSANITYSRIYNRVSTSASSIDGTSTIRFYARDGSGIYTDVEFTVINTLTSDNRPSEDNISVFPNPVTDYLNVVLSEAVSGARYEIYSMQGVKVMDGNVTNSDMQVIDVSSLENGIYTVRIISGEKEHTTRVIKK